MTAAQVLKLNGNMRDSPLMEVVRRFHALATAKELPYCVVGGMAVIRNGYERTTMDIDILTFKEAWRHLLPLKGRISSQGPENCVDSEAGVTIDIRFADEDWEMAIPMPDPRNVGEYDEGLGARFIGLHALVQLKMAVHISKLQKSGMEVAAKDLSDVYELIRRSLPKFSKEIIQTYDSAVRENCMKAFESAVRASKEARRARKDIKR
jgi:histone H3/H4